jgi:hypothetical protein
MSFDHEPPDKNRKKPKMRSIDFRALCDQAEALHQVPGRLQDRAVPIYQFSGRTIYSIGRGPNAKHRAG